MVKRILPLLLAPLLLAGCTATMTNLSPHQLPRNSNNLYPLEVRLDTRQQSLRWDSLKPQIVVGNISYPMRPTPLMTNRFEGLVPVPANADGITYRYRIDYEYNSLGKPKPGSALSEEYSLRITGQ
jgi:hypothetical protein